MLFSQLWQPLASLATPLQAPLFDSIASASPDQMSSQFPTFAFSNNWSVLGPFQIGTRGMLPSIRSMDVNSFSSRSNIWR